MSSLTHQPTKKTTYALIAFLSLSSFYLGSLMTHQNLLLTPLSQQQHHPSRDAGLQEVRDKQVSTVETTVAPLHSTNILHNKEPRINQTNTPQTPTANSKWTTLFHPARPEELEAIHNLLEPRIWEYWPTNRSLPCYPPDETLGWKEEWELGNNNIQDVGSHSHLGGLFMAKPKKVGGSTAAGVHIWILHKVAERLKKNYTACRGNVRHGTARNYNPIQETSFFWSVVRDPTKRAISAFFHFDVSRQKVEPTDENFLQALKLWPHRRNNKNKNTPLGHYGTVLSLQDPKGMDPLEVYRNILKEYHFIAVTERMDESLVVLKELMGLQTSDILHLNAKQNGSWDAGGSANGCTWIQPSYVSPTMQQVFQSTEWLGQRSQYNLALHVAVNKSLDLTIEHRIGRDRFQAALQEYQMAQTIVQERCQEKARFPCSPGGDRLERKETNCYWADAGCGYPCIDRVAAELRL